MSRVTHGIVVGNRPRGIGLLVSGNHTPPFRSDEVRYQRSFGGVSPGVAQGAPLLPPNTGASDVSVRRTFGSMDAMAIASSLSLMTAALALERAQTPQHMIDAWKFAGGLIGVGWAIIKLMPWLHGPCETPATLTDVKPRALRVHGDDTGLSALSVAED